MRALFIDDDPNRHRRFKIGHIGWVIEEAFTYQQAIELLQGNAFDEVWLDHDLSERAAAGNPAPGEKNGADIAKVIAELPQEKRPKKVIVHTFSLKGRTRIMTILEDAGVSAVVAPFGM